MNKRLCAALLAAVMMSFSAAAMAESPLITPAPAMDRTSITVQGTAEVTADPDMVSVTASASVTAGTVGSAQEEMNKIVESATTKLLELGVLDDDIVTVSYSYYPRYNYETSTVTGYEASHMLEITCRDVDMLDGVIGALTDSGVSEICSVNYDVSARSELYQQALDLAIARAEAKAARMAAASGLTITGMESLTENYSGSEGYSVNITADSAMLKSAAGATGIRAGSVSVSASVTAVYEATK